MADVGEEFSVALDTGGRVSGNVEVVAATSWAELLQYDPDGRDDHQAKWIPGTEAEIREKLARAARAERCSTESALQLALEQERASGLYDDESSSEAESESSESADESRPRRRQRVAEGKGEGSGDEKGDAPDTGEDYNRSVALLQAAGAALSNKAGRRRDGAGLAGKRVRHDVTATAFKNAGRHAPSQFVALLLVLPCDASRLCLEEGSGGVCLGVYTALEDAARDEDVYVGPHVSSIRSVAEIHPKGRSLLWTALGGVVARQNHERSVSINVRIRLRLGRKVFRNTSALAKALRAASRTVDGCHVLGAEAFCGIVNNRGTGDTQFHDYVERSEYERIHHALSGLPADRKTSEHSSIVFQFHMRLGRERLRVTCCEQESGQLRVVKVKRNSKKYVSVDVFHPVGYDYRYDVRTTDNVTQQTELFQECAALMACFAYSHDIGTLVLRSELPPGADRFTVQNLRVKHKVQFHVRGCGLGVDDGATKVSLSRTLQHEYTMHDARQLLQGEVKSCPIERYEVGAQLLSSKRLFDKFKSGQLELGTSISATVMEQSRLLVPQALAALQQLSPAEAAATDAAIRKGGTLSIAPAGETADDDMDVDDV